MVKTIRRSVIFPTPKKCIFGNAEECKFTCTALHEMYFWILRKKRRIYNFLFCWIHPINRWKMLKNFKNCVERIERSEVNLSLITLAICNRWCLIWNNVISWIPLSLTPKIMISGIWKEIYSLLRIYSRPSTKFIVLRQKMNKMRRSKYRRSLKNCCLTEKLISSIAPTQV